jgi:type I restriction enzyme, S subunit
MNTMNPDWLLKHFEQISEAPDAIPRLRRFILDLAVRGRLVEQDPKDEPVDLLIAQILAEREQRAIEGIPISLQTSADVSNVRFLIPHSWKWVKLGVVTNTRRRLLEAALHEALAV